MGGPQVDVVGCEGGEDGGEEFGGSAVEEGGGFVEDETDHIIFQEMNVRTG